MLSHHALRTSALILFALSNLAMAQKAQTSAQLAKEYGLSLQEYLLIQRVKIAHGTMMGLAFAFMYPFGAAVIRGLSGRPYTLKLHGWWQFVSYIITLSGFGMGVWLVVVEGNDWEKKGHAVIGSVVVGLLSLMAPLGMLHHRNFAKRGRRSVFTWLHIYIGRPVLVLGGINGGLGIWLNKDMPFYAIYAYSIVAGVFYLVWLAAALYWWSKTKTRGAVPTPWLSKSTRGSRLAAGSPSPDPDSEKNVAAGLDRVVERKDSDDSSLPTGSETEIRVVEHAQVDGDAKEMEV